jgi:23S rRNA-/tRNA-specific pseudouridylate synthase
MDIAPDGHLVILEPECRVFHVYPNGQVNSDSHYNVQTAQTCSDLRVGPDGRTHQIRVHFAHRRHALVGDPAYGGRLALPKGASAAVVTALRQFRRQALHANRLEFQHPVSGEALRLEVDPPADFKVLTETLQQDAAK